MGYDATEATFTNGAINTSYTLLSPELKPHIHNLEAFLSEYFPSSPYLSELQLAVKKLSYHVVSPWEGEMSNVIHSTALGGKAGTPDVFRGWADMDGWEIEVDDPGGEGMEDKLVTMVGNGPSGAKWLWLWRGIPHPVIRSDLLRYLTILAKGGIYVDSDTDPLVRPEHWATDTYDEMTPRAISGLSKEIDSLTRSQQDVERGHGIARDDVSMVLSLEMAGEMGGNRRIQFANFAFMAKAFHPALLDTVMTIVRTLEKGMEYGFDPSIGAANLSGPAPWTDAILRYLLITQAVTPTTFKNLPRAAKAGDIVILPVGSFAFQDEVIRQLSEEESRIQGKFVHHAGAGSWKNSEWRGL